MSNSKRILSQEETKALALYFQASFIAVIAAESLKAIDNYLVEYVRFLRSGRHTKKNFVVDYTEIKELGFKSLVNAYYG